MPSRRSRAYRLTALLLAVGVCSALGVGSAQPWHLHLLEGLRLFHGHSHLGGHHHAELHALAEGTHRPDEHALPSPGHERTAASAEAATTPGSGGESEEDEPHDSDCTLVGGGPTCLESSSATFAAPALVAQRREALRPTALRLREPVSRPGARAPPA